LRRWAGGGEKRSFIYRRDQQTESESMRKEKDYVSAKEQGLFQEGTCSAAMGKRREWIFREGPSGRKLPLGLHKGAGRRGRIRKI